MQILLTSLDEYFSILQGLTMTHVSALDAQIISNLNSTLAIFKFSDDELNALALGILEGLNLTGATAPLLELAYTSNNVKRMLAGELTS